MKKHIALYSTLILAPSIVAADGGIKGFLDIVSGIIDAIIPVIISLTVLYFLWGLAQYLWQDDKDAGKEKMIWGVITLFVMVSIWGLVGLLNDTFGLDKDVINIPNLTP